jgi:hypothetical protein
MSALTQLINTVSRHLREKSIPHAVVGGVAVAIWGRPRATEDIDMIVDLGEEQLAPLHEYLKEHGIKMNADKAQKAVKAGHPFPLYDNWSIHWVDVRPPVRPIDRMTLERATIVEIGGEKVPVATPEDTLLGKLIAGGPQDLLDAKSILLRRADTLDIPYLENRVRELDLREQWARLQTPSTTADTPAGTPTTGSSGQE